MFSSIVSASKAWIVFLVLGSICLFVIALFVLSKKRDEKNKKAWEENVRRNKILQKQMEDQQKKEMAERLDKEIETILNAKVNSIEKLYHSKKCTNVVENFFESKTTNHFNDLDFFIMPKKYFINSNNENVKNTSLAIKYSEMMSYVSKQMKQQMKHISENFEVGTEKEDILSSNFKFKFDVYNYFSDVLIRNALFCINDVQLMNEMKEHDLSSLKNGINSIDSLFLGLNGLGVIKNFSLEDFYTFIGLKQHEYNYGRVFEFCDKYEISYEETTEAINIFIAKLEELKEDYYSNYFVSNPNNPLFEVIRNILSKDGANDLAEFLILIIHNSTSMNYKSSIDFSKSLLSIYDETEKAKVKASNFINGVKENETITISDVDSMNGVEFEEFVAKMFDKLGYTTEVTKASGDQGVDVVAKKDGKVLGIQAKCYSGVVGNHAIMEVVAGMNYYGCNCCMVVTNSTFTAAAKELARANRVELWDRNNLKEQMELLEM